MLNKKKLVLLIISLSFICSLTAQMTNSPYSRYGYGVLKDQAVGPSKSMGGIGYGLRHKLGANPMNPASYSNVDSLTFMFDMSVNYTNSKLSEGGINQADDNGGLDYVTLLFPVYKDLGVSFGVVPYSSVGYSFGNHENIGGVDFEKTYDGSGGLSQVYAGLGYKMPFVKGLSLGANVSYIFGKMKHSRSLPSISGVSGAYMSVENMNLKVEAFKFDLGAQYEFNYSAKDKFVAGAFFSPKINSKGDYQRLQTGYDSNGSIVAGSTSGDTINNVPAGIPMTLGFGVSWIHNEKLTVGVDVTYQNWNKVKYTEYMGDGMKSSDRFNNRWKFAAGAEYMIDPMERNFVKRIRFRGGVNYSNSYMNVSHTDSKGLIQNKGYDEYGATIGLGLPIRDLEDWGGRTTYININFEYKRIDPNVKSMIKEQYFGVSVGVNFNEVWFWRNKIR